MHIFRAKYPRSVVEIKGPAVLCKSCEFSCPNVIEQPCPSWIVVTDEIKMKLKVLLIVRRSGTTTDRKIGVRDPAFFSGIDRHYQQRSGTSGGRCQITG